MDSAKPTRKKDKKQKNFGQVLRASIFILFGLLIVNLYYLSTKDQLLPQILHLFSAILGFVQSIPTSILMFIGYTIVIFYVGYLVGKKMNK